jgi:hypothetical protein
MKKIGLIVFCFSLIGCKRMDILNNSKHYLWSFSGKTTVADINAKYHTVGTFNDADIISVGELLYHSDSILVFRSVIFKGIEKEFRKNIQLNLNSKTRQIETFKFIDLEQYRTGVMPKTYNDQYSMGYYTGYKSPEPEFFNIAHSFSEEYGENILISRYNFKDFDYKIVHHLKEGRAGFFRHSSPKGGHDFYVIKDKKTNRKVRMEGSYCHIYLYKEKYLLVVFNVYREFEDIGVGLIDLSEYFKNSK